MHLPWGLPQHHRLGLACRNRPQTDMLSLCTWVHSSLSPKSQLVRSFDMVDLNRLVLSVKDQSFEFE